MHIGMSLYFARVPIDPPLRPEPAMSSPPQSHRRRGCRDVAASCEGRRIISRIFERLQSRGLREIGQDYGIWKHGCDDLVSVSPSHAVDAILKHALRR